MHVRPAYSAGTVKKGVAGEKLNWNWEGTNSVVLVGSALEVTGASFAYFPEREGFVGRADFVGRDANGSAVWRFQTLYVEPRRSLILSWPTGLRVEAGGSVHIGFTSEGPGTITVDVVGRLISV
jgi:hypothetical protein